MPEHGLTSRDTVYAIRHLLAEVAAQHVKGFHPRMHVHRCFGARGATGPIYAQEVFRGGERGHRPYLSHLAAAGDDPPGGPSVKSQALPATSAASAVGLAAACALARVGKVSMRQNNGPGGSCDTFFSATGVTSNFCAWAAVERSKAWLFTLGPSGRSSPGGSKIAKIGPVPAITAPEYLLRVVRSGGPLALKHRCTRIPGRKPFTS